MVTEESKVNDDALQLGGVLSIWINNDKPNCPNTVSGSGVACQLFIYMVKCIEGHYKD